MCNLWYSINKIFWEAVYILISLEECRTYEYQKVKEAVLKTFENLGGVEKYIKKGDKELL